MQQRTKEQVVVSGDTILVMAPAKINLSLLIAGKRPDGFHEIRTIMAKVNWYDELLLESGDKEGIELTCTGKYYAPVGSDNLVYRACQLLSQKAGLQPSLKLTLTKNIPAGAGLGSGSSDAAAALIGLNHLANISLNQHQLMKIGAELGSDVPFFLGPSLALCTGRGEKIKKIENFFDFLAILILPNITVCTKRVYENYKHNTALFESLNTTINQHMKKNRIDLVARMCANMLSESCFGLYNKVADFKTRIELLGVKPVCLSGSGSAMFFIVEGGDEEKAK